MITVHTWWVVSLCYSADRKWPRVTS